MLVQVPGSSGSRQPGDAALSAAAAGTATEDDEEIEVVQNGVASDNAAAPAADAAVPAGDAPTITVLAATVAADAPAEASTSTATGNKQKVAPIPKRPKRGGT